MKREQVTLEIMDALNVPLGVNTPRMSVDIGWLIYFANRILEASRNCARAQEADVVWQSRTEPSAQTSIEEKPVVQKVVQRSKKSHPVEPTEPPPGSISHQDMLDIILARREIKTAKEIGAMVGCHPAMIQQICKETTPVSERVARGFGYQRHKVGNDFWFTRMPKEGEVRSNSPAQTNSIKPNSSHDGLPKIVRTSPFEGAPRVVHRGPFQQLLDASLVKNQEV